MITHSCYGFAHIERMRKTLVVLAWSMALLAGELLSARFSIAEDQKVDLPDRINLFMEDSRDSRKLEKNTIKSIIQSDPAPDQALDFKAPRVEFEKDSNIVSGVGGVVISGRGIQIQAEKGSADLSTKQVKAEGHVVMTDDQGQVSAEQIDFNIDKEVGTLSGAQFQLNEGGFVVDSHTTKKLSEFEYEFSDASMSTCQCGEGNRPWYLSSDRCHVTQEGYAHCYGTSLNIFGGVPVLYTPYFGFPAKTERTSGLLVPTVGYSNRHGFITRIPYFGVIDDSTDLTLTPFTETRSRTGALLDFRKAFSRRHSLDSTFTFSNESARGDSLQGTNVNGIFDPRPQDPTNRLWDENRFGWYMSQSWRSEEESDLDASLVSDIHYISDDLFLREIEDSRVGTPQDRYTTSVVAANVNLGEFASFDARGEYNQSLEVDDDLVLQRLPEARLQGSRTFRPFGYNPFGFKVTTKGVATATNFSRDTGYDGWRTDLAPSVVMPIRYKNYFNSALSVGVNQTYYSLDNAEVPNSNSVIEDSQDRTLPQFSYTISTAVERVFDLEPGNMLSTLAALGAENQSLSLERVKHVIEPYVMYSHVPDTSQEKLPLFDSFDRVRGRKLATYGVSTTLLGRFLPSGSSSDISELAPEVSDIPSVGLNGALPEFGMDTSDLASVSPRRGEIRRLAVLNLRQSFDRMEDEKDLDPNRRPYSDIAADLSLFPNKSFAFQLGSNYDPYDRNNSSWYLLSSLRTDRGDALRARYSYLRDSISQIEGNLEIVLSDRMKLGYYARYDDQEKDFIENNYALRFSGACDCWSVDVGVRDRLNPDQKAFLVNFTLSGLGDISQDVFVSQRDRQTK